MGSWTQALECCLVLTLLGASTTWSHDRSGVEHVGERTAAFLASPFVAAFDPVPLVPRLQAAPAVPQAPPGMCRWERIVLDDHGQPILDRYGWPMKEYAIGSCVAPPAH